MNAIMTNSRRKAKVFISCGQSDENDERLIAHTIGEELIAIGFDIYIAVNEQTLAGLKDNIFRQLETSDYIVFVDLKREVLDASELRRGSLFSHQELAIASFLDIPVIGFREDGVKSDDGIAKFIQANFAPFSDRRLLPAAIAQKINKCGWQPKCFNTLTMERNPAQYTDAHHTVQGRRRPNRFYQIGVKNNHGRKIAQDCFVYLESIKNLQTGESIPTMNIEFKWEAYLFPSAIILANQTRRFDAFYVYHDAPQKLRFNLHSDYFGAFPNVPEGPGQFEFTYLVASDNFGVSRGTFSVTIGSTLDEIRLE